MPIRRTTSSPNLPQHFAKRRTFTTGNCHGSTAQNDSEKKHMDFSSSSRSLPPAPRRRIRFMPTSRGAGHPHRHGIGISRAETFRLRLPDQLTTSTGNRAIVSDLAGIDRIGSPNYADPSCPTTGPTSASRITFNLKERVEKPDAHRSTWRHR